MEALSIPGSPVDTVQSNGGGVRLAAWYQPQRTTLDPEQPEVLRRLMTSAEPDDRVDQEYLKALPTQGTPEA